MTRGYVDQYSASPIGWLPASFLPAGGALSQRPTPNKKYWGVTISILKNIGLELAVTPGSSSPQADFDLHLWRNFNDHEIMKSVWLPQAGSNKSGNPGGRMFIESEEFDREMALLVHECKASRKDMVEFELKYAWHPGALPPVNPFN